MRCLASPPAPASAGISSTCSDRETAAVHQPNSALTQRDIVPMSEESKEAWLMVWGLVLRGATCRCRSASLSLGRELESPEVRLCTGGLVGSKMSVQVLRAVSTAALVLYLALGGSISLLR